LGDRDFFGDCVAALKERGIRAIGRFSPDLQWKETVDARPEWFRRDKEGNFSPLDQAPGLYHTCMFTSYLDEHMPAIMREVNSRYDIDGIFTNAWPWLGTLPDCYCDVCRSAPKGEHSPEAYDRRLNRVLELWDLFTAIAKEKKSDNVYLGNLGWGIHARLNIKAIGERCFWFNCDNQGRGGRDTPAWGCAQQGRIARSVMKGKTITNVTGAWGTGHGTRWRNSAKNPVESTLWMAQTVASGMRIWYHWVGGQTGMGEDRRWQEPGRLFMNWMARHDPHFTYNKPIANLGVVFSQLSNAHYTPAGAEGNNPNTEFLEGLYYTLLEGRFFFDFVHEDDFGAENLKKYDALILPNVALLSDGQCQQLRAYADAGGSLLATFQTSLFDETGTRRKEFGLGDVFGIHQDGDVEGPMGNGYYARIRKTHPIIDGFGDTNWLPGGEYRQLAQADADPVATVVPPYTLYPPERAYEKKPSGNISAIAISEKVRSRRVYFPGDMERAAWRSGNTDMYQVLKNAISWVLHDHRPVKVEGEGVVEMFAWETDPGFALHVVNYTNPNFHRGWTRHHYPIGQQEVTMEIPLGVNIGRVQLLRAETDIPFTQTGNRIHFTIPSINDYEVAALTRM
jgi:hypothetical protein